MFRRFNRFAPLLAPAVLSGIHRVPPGVFAVASLAATSWTLSTGLGGYFLGPSAANILSDIGVRGAIAIVLISALALVGRYLWRLRNPPQSASEDSARS
jgi:membrane protein DedA with SNARE-associated domain